jgi:F-box interacting protein
VGLLEESLVPVGRKSEEIVYSSPWRKAWSDVLKWLPTRSVVASIRVCKEWRAVINNARFAETHALHANLGKSHRIQLVDAYPLFDVSYHPLEFCERVEDKMMPFLFDRAISSVVCSKPCNGLILVSYIRYTSDTEGSCSHFLCNPSREYYSRIYPDQVDADDSSLSIARVGLAYDPRRNKHVLVRLVCYDKGSRDYQPECYIKLTDTTSWISISPPPRPVNDLRPAYAHGKLYWMVDSQLGTKSSELLALDVGTREFEVLRGPPCRRDRITSIVELQGNICILCSDRGANAIDVWTLEGGLWTMGYRIDLRESQQMYSSDETTLLAVDPEDGRILLSTGKALGYYDPETRALETIYRLGEHLQDMEFAPALCQESLLRPRLE